MRRRPIPVAASAPPRRFPRSRAGGLGAGRLALALGLGSVGVGVGGSARAQGAAGAETRIEIPAGRGAGAEAEMRLAPAAELPLCGPRYAPVTIDVFAAIGTPQAAANLQIVQRTLTARSPVEVRALLYPMLGSAVAERGGEAIFEVCSGRPERCCDFAARLAAHPEWLEPTLEAETELAQAAAAYGVPPARLRHVLRTHAHWPRMRELGEAAREAVRYPPETWINGRRLRGTISDVLFSEEFDRQRGRALQALRGGARLSALYEQLVREERENNPGSERFGRGGSRWGWGGGPGSLFTPAPPDPALVPGDRAARAVQLDLSRAPRRGPAIAPVTVTLVGSLDSYGTYVAARVLEEVWDRHPGALRMAFLHGGSAASSPRVTQFMASVALIDPAMFWRVYEGLLEHMRTRFMLRYPDVVEVARRQGAWPALYEVGPGRELLATQQLERDRKQAQRLEPLPVVVVNGRVVRAPFSAQALEQVVERELRQGLLSGLAARREPR